jgi:leader peptidase (prepilin peptidase) / N-methyltransferase
LGVPRAPGRPVAVLSPAATVLRPRRIGVRCGAVEMIGVVAVMVVAMTTLTGLLPPAAGVAIGLLVPPAVVDVHEQRLPDIWIATALGAFATALAVNALLGGSVDLRGVVAGALAMSVPIIVLHLISPAAMGFGDVKLSIVLGSALGSVDWRLAMVALCAAGLLGAAYGAAARRRTVPFGPFLVFGTLVTLITSDSILSALVDAGAPA